MQTVWMFPEECKQNDSSKDWPNCSLDEVLLLDCVIILFCCSIGAGIGGILFIVGIITMVIIIIPLVTDMTEGKTQDFLSYKNPVLLILSSFAKLW